ncbi:acyltransferase [Hymenobacter qilianensis]|uniref:Acyltransferase n=2 Tax=Hymenobacter qilianensis TaxID=1385715 RepID=A0ACB5PX01_9BACT|nr:acyltransferase [Hymenobacter qilianensis]QNP54253.1 acyltransferase [Hymenobacter qilianensis]GGF79735.1 acyltransferase [Hymenobacter qilianensis]
MRYIAQLDALRALAILFVLINHTVPKSHPLFTLSDKVSGPDIFFTLSGFLITALLLRDRQAVALQRTTKRGVFLRFFLKRALRLYPAYLLLLGLDFFWRGIPAANYGPYVSFTSNLVIYQQQDWGPLAHLWTMAVEQQFYLLWPFVLVLLPRPWLPYAMALFVGGGLYSQYAVPTTGFGHVLPHTCLDALGLGALLAWVVLEKPQYFNQVYRGLGGLALASIVLMLAQSAWGLDLYLNQRTLVAVLVVWLMAYFVVRGETKGGMVNAVFTAKPLLFIGKLSYGIYLYHLTVLSCAYPVLDRLNHYLPFYERGAYGYWLVESLLLIGAVAWGSWNYVERPLTAWSKHFVRNKTTPTRPRPALAAT